MQPYARRRRRCRRLLPPPPPTICQQLRLLAPAPVYCRENSFTYSMGRLISQHGSPAAGSQLPTPAGWQQHAQQIPQQHYRQQRQPALPQRQQLHAHDATPPPVTFVPASPADVDACLAIQHATYPAALWEERAVVASILSHACSFLALEGGPPVGYLQLHLVADPASPPPLNHPLPPPPPPLAALPAPSSAPSSPTPASSAAPKPASRPAACGTSPAPRPLSSAPRHHLFIHDLCLLPSHHGRGLGSRLAQHTLARLAPHAASVSCVALPGRDGCVVGGWGLGGQPTEQPDHTAIPVVIDILVTCMNKPCLSFSIPPPPGHQPNHRPVCHPLPPDAVGFWRRLGFVPPRVAPRAAAEAALSTYPAGSQLLLLAADHGDGGPA